MKNRKSGVFYNKEDDTDVITLRGAIMFENKQWLNEMEYDYICPKHVEDALKNTGDNLKVIINSQGGDVYAGVEIYNMLKSSGKNITTVISGRASSAASIVAQAGNKRLIYDNSQILSHRAWTFGFGNCNDFLDIAEELERVDANLRTIYMKTFSGSEQELIDLMNEDRHMNSQEALEKGFVDEVIEGQFENTTSNKVENSETISNEKLEDVVNIVIERISQKDKEDRVDNNKDTENNLFKNFKGVK